MWMGASKASCGAFQIIVDLFYRKFTNLIGIFIMENLNCVRLIKQKWFVTQ